ncbi:exonuclease [Streptomyces chattanoogensis]|uniref:exonuclease n=1 Tax=Streptomyces chattanoogensis TaxID=66876 RepID=UPI0036CB032E
MPKLPELYIAVDVEADGPIPGPYSMISLGMAVVDRPDLSFSTELRPLSEDFVPQALAVSGLDRDRLVREAPAPEEAGGGCALGQRAARDRPPGLSCGTRGVGRDVCALVLHAVSRQEPVRCHRVRGRSPELLDGADRTRVGGEPKGDIKQALKLTGLPHTHHAGEDARELARVFEAVVESRGR